MKPGSILNRRTGVRRKLRADGLAAMRAALDFGPRFGHRQGTLRQVEALAALIIQRRRLFQTAPLALGTNFQPVNRNLSGGLDPLQGLTRMAGLAAGLATAGGAQTVAGGGLAAVGTVAGQLTAR